MYMYIDSFGLKKLTVLVKSYDRHAMIWITVTEPPPSLILFKLIKGLIVFLMCIIIRFWPSILIAPIVTIRFFHFCVVQFFNINNL